MLDDLLSSPITLVSIIAAIGLGGVLALLATRRKRATRGFEDSIMTGTDIKTNTVFGNTGGGVVNTGDSSSMTTGFSRQGLGNIDTDEVDPIAEAEVYLAYGRDAQAEEILRDALQKDPQRHEIYLKLLEIQAHNNRREAFESIAGELYTATKGEGEIWQRAAAMGRQLDPRNVMYSEGTESPADVPTAPLFEKTEPGEAGSRLDAIAAAAAAPLDETQVFTIRPALMPESTKTQSGLDFHLDELSTRPGIAMPEAVQEEKEANLLQWESPKFTPPPAEAEKAGDDSWSASTVALEAPAEHPAPVLTAVETTAKVMTLHEARPAVTGLDLDKLDLSFDPQRAPVEDPTPSVLDGQWHDAATKLDLARAYQEMGDLEGAREILQEVLHEGDGDQKKEAQTLLDKLRAA
jgi:pilus assembly protein FimV